MEFTGKTLIITGAAGGIGREVARQFAAEGADLVLADREALALEALAASLPGPGAKKCIVQDAASPADADRVVDLALTIRPTIDFIVPAAGIYRAEPFAQMSDEAWRDTLSINLDGVFYLLRRASAHLAENSAIVNITSLAGHRGAFSNAHYSTTKGALTSLTRSLARELAPKTRVNAVAPGVIATAMTEALRETRGEASLKDTPLARFGTAAEVADSIYFLCSRRSSFITGETIHVNGGIYML